MKRTLIEVFCGLAVLVMMVSFHHQVARIEVQQADVGALEEKLETAIEQKVESREQLDALRQQLVAQTESRIAELERALLAAAAGSDQAQVVADELERAQHDVALFRTQLSTNQLCVRE